MDVSVVLTLVQTLIQLLDTPVGEEIESLWGYKSQLEKLKATMSTIRAVLLDAEKQERQQLELSHTLQDKLGRLKEAVYKADDLFDEVATLAQRKKLMSGSSVRKEVRLFFSRFNQLRSAFNMSREVKKIKEILNDVVRDHHGFSSRPQHGHEVCEVKTERDSHSFVHEEDVIVGRDQDKRIVIDMLLDSSVAEDVSFVTIVGMGGLGKTTLAQLVYNDETIEREFPLKMWVCVFNDFHTKLLHKILTSVTNQTDYVGLEMEQLQRRLRQELEGKKYLLVLDDVWNEDFNKWHKLKILLIGGGRGSRVIVTTRSKRVADMVGNRYMFELHGLSERDSWNLFERMTLETGQDEVEPYLVNTGKEIVQKCANVPLAIRVVGSLLRGQAESRWRFLKNTALANIEPDENDIVRALKISYYYLPYHLKSCFSYCAVFPKHYKIKKEDLISLWMAQGFIVPLGGESLEDAGEEYFMNLLQRCFFQDVERADNGEILTCKMHDLIHDLATEVAGAEILSFSYDTSYFDKKTRHLFVNNTVGRKDFRRYLTTMKRMRTILNIGYPNPLESPEVLLPKVRYLRVLDLHGASFEKLPNMIGELLHLRYLDLSCNRSLSVLPLCITELYNLQTFLLRGCESLKELPRGFRKLVNLRCLDIFDCNSMTHMPPGMNSMTCLNKLTMFLVGGTSSACCLRPVGAGGLSDLKYLNNLTGSMEIKVHRGLTYDTAEAKKGGHLINKQNLRGINICWTQKLCGMENSRFIKDDSEGANAEALLHGLQPHPNLKLFGLWDYPGVRFPSWGSSLVNNLEACLPNIVEIELYGCKSLEHLPLLSQLRYLKSLELVGLIKLEYVESIYGDKAPTASVVSRKAVSIADDLVFFPSLEKLVLGNLQELKGWWRSSLHLDTDSGDSEAEPFTKSFPRLSYLHIWLCWNLTDIPLCPKLEKLELSRFNKALGPITRPRSERRCVGDVRSSSTESNRLYPGDDSPSTSSTQQTQQEQQQQQQQQQQQILGGLKEVKIDKVGYLKSLPRESFQSLSHLVVRGDHDMESLTEEAGEVFRSGRLSSLHSLVISDCSNLKRLSGKGVWEHLTALKSLHLKLLSELELDDDYGDLNTRGCTTEDNHGTDTDIPWKCLHQTLHSLVLWYLPKLVKLPKGMNCLSSLQFLQITNCDNFEALPSWIACFSCLQSLVIRNCKRLKSLPEEICHLGSLQQLDLRGCSPVLKERCQESTGADWPKIQHIPRIDV